MTKDELKEKAQDLTIKNVTQGKDKFYSCGFYNGCFVGLEENEKRIEELENQNRLLGERCNQLLKDKGELTDKIADIKANCDLAIEGRDIKIKELEKEKERLKGDLELWESGGCRATNLFKCGVVKELKEQMEKMKCCATCRHKAKMLTDKKPCKDCDNGCNWEK